jgi:hypothetical protein
MSDTHDKKDDVTVDSPNENLLHNLFKQPFKDTHLNKLT